MRALYANIVRTASGVIIVLMSTRRERLRAELIDDIKTTALEHLQAHGADGLSLRAVARDVGLSAPGMYRYFDSRDDLLTSLIADSYNDLADHVLHAADADAALPDTGHGTPRVPDRAARDAPPAARFQAAARAYRAWSLAHPNEFGLLFGTPIPGYAAPEGGVTVAAVRRMSIALLRPLVEAHLVGRLHIPDGFAEGAVTSRLESLRADIAALAEAGVPPALPGFLLAVWSRIHGFVSLEVFHQFAFAFGDDAGPLFEAELAALVDATFDVG